MCDVSLLKSRFDRLNESQILKPLKIKKKKKKNYSTLVFSIFWWSDSLYYCDIQKGKHTW